MTDTVRLVAGDDEAEISLLGAEARVWRSGGKGILWRSDPQIWPRTSPVLFPIVGRTRNNAIVVGGRSYPMQVHGFAAASRFAVVQQAADSILLRLTDDELTRRSFPFSFRLEIAYRLMPGCLSAEFSVENTDRQPLPYALGLHPGFSWPFSGSNRVGHRIDFAAPERADVPVITNDGLFSDARRRVPLAGGTLPLTDSILADEALCFLDAASRSLRFVGPDGAAISIDVQDFPHLAIWSRPPAPFLSIEAWTGHGDPHGFSGELADKPSMRMLPVGGRARHGLRMHYQPAA